MTQPTLSLCADTQLIFDLVSTASVSENELDAARVFVEHAKTRGFESFIDEVGNAIADRNHNPNIDQIHLVLLGHIDTVPGEIPVRIEDGILHGRGSVDAKGPLCAMLAAASIAQVPDSVRLTVIGAVGEEAAGSVGARHIVHQYTPDACVIGEPSGHDGVTLGYKGRLLCRATSRCSNAHSAGAEHSAPDLAFQWWNQVRLMINDLNQQEDNIFDQVQASILSTNSSSDGLEQSADLMVGFRLPCSVSADGLRDRIQLIMQNEISVVFSGSENAYITDRNDPVVRALSVSIRSRGHQPRPKRKTGTADLNVVAPIWKCPIAAYGPGDSSLDHTPNEHLHLNEYQDSILILKDAIETLADEFVDTKQGETP